MASFQLSLVYSLLSFQKLLISKVFHRFLSITQHLCVYIPNHVPSHRRKKLYVRREWLSGKTTIVCIFISVKRKSKLHVGVNNTCNCINNASSMTFNTYIDLWARTLGRKFVFVCCTTVMKFIDLIRKMKRKEYPPSVHRNFQLNIHETK